MKDGQRAARITAPERYGGSRAKSRPILDRCVVRERTRSSMPAGAKFFDTENLLCHPPERDVLGGTEDAYDVEATGIPESPMNSVKTRPQRLAEEAGAEEDDLDVVTVREDQIPGPEGVSPGSTPTVGMPPEAPSWKPIEKSN